MTQPKSTEPKNAVEAQAVPAKGARGAYRKKECPYCHKHFGNLGNHINQLHKTEAEAQGKPAGPAEITKDQLTGKTPAPPPRSVDSPIYYCTECKAELRKGENPCWHCGAVLVWEGI